MRFQVSKRWKGESWHLEARSSERDTGHFVLSRLSLRLYNNSFRYDFGDIRNDGPPRLSELRTAIIVALLSIGTLIGSLIAGPVADSKKIGRKYSICIWAGVLTIGNALQIAAQHPYWELLLVGRIVAGIGGS